MNKDDKDRFDRIEDLLMACVQGPQLIDKNGNGHWHLKKEVTIAHILSSLAVVGLILTAWYSLSGAVDVLAAQTKNVTEARIVAVETKIDLTDTNVQRSLDSITTELRIINEKLDAKADR